MFMRVLDPCYYFWKVNINLIYIISILMRSAWAALESAPRRQPLRIVSEQAVWKTAPSAGQRCVTRFYNNFFSRTQVSKATSDRSELRGKKPANAKQSLSPSSFWSWPAGFGCVIGKPSRSPFDVFVSMQSVPGILILQFSKAGSRVMRS